MPYARPATSRGISIATQQVEIHRYSVASESDEPYDTAEPDKPWEPAFELVGAVIEPMPASVERGAGTQGVGRYRIVCDPCTIDHRYFVIDPLSGWVYQVIWAAMVAHPLRGIAGFPNGWGHIEGEMERVEGLI